MGQPFFFFFFVSTLIVLAQINLAKTLLLKLGTYVHTV